MSSCFSYTDNSQSALEGMSIALTVKFLVPVLLALMAVEESAVLALMHALASPARYAKTTQAVLGILLVPLPKSPRLSAVALAIRPVPR